MAVAIDTHALLVNQAASGTTTGTLTASPGDLAVAVVKVASNTPVGSASGGGLTWTNQYNLATGSVFTQVYTAPVYSSVSAQTITITTTSGAVAGLLIAFSGAIKVGSPVGVTGAGVASLTKSLTTTSNGSMVVGLITGAPDVAITSPAVQIDNNAANTASAQSAGTNTPGTLATIAATSAGSNLNLVSIFEVSMAHPTSLNNYQFVQVGDGMSVTEKIR